MRSTTVRGHFYATHGNIRPWSCSILRSPCCRFPITALAASLIVVIINKSKTAKYNRKTATVGWALLVGRLALAQTHLGPPSFMESLRAPCIQDCMVGPRCACSRLTLLSSRRARGKCCFCASASSEILNALLLFEWCIFLLPSVTTPLLEVDHNALMHGTAQRVPQVACRLAASIAGCEGSVHLYQTPVVFSSVRPQLAAFVQR